MASLLDNISVKETIEERRSRIRISIANLENEKKDTKSRLMIMK